MRERMLTPLFFTLVLILGIVIGLYIGMALQPHPLMEPAAPQPMQMVVGSL